MVGLFATWGLQRAAAELFVESAPDRVCHGDSEEQKRASPSCITDLGKYAAQGLQEANHFGSILELRKPHSNLSNSLWFQTLLMLVVFNITGNYFGKIVV